MIEAAYGKEVDGWVIAADGADVTNIVSEIAAANGGHLKLNPGYNQYFGDPVPNWAKYLSIKANVIV